MKVLLVGGLGFIGRSFITKFSKIHKILVISENDSKQKIKDVPSNSFEFEPCRVEDKKIVDEIVYHKPEVVVHLAALTGISRCENDPENAYRINVDGTQNVLEGCVKSKSKLIFLSSREVYGETIGKQSSEDDELKPNNLYGMTKLLGERSIISKSNEVGLDYTIFRITNVYGPSGDRYGAQVIINDIIKKRHVKILGRNQKINYVFVDDIADLINMALDDSRFSKQIFNLGSRDNFTIEEFVDKVSKVAGIQVTKEYLPMRKGETINFKPDLRKIENLLGGPLKTSFDEGVKKTIEWYRKHEPIQRLDLS